MSNPFEDACTVEQKGLAELVPFLKKKSYEGRFVSTAKGNLSRMLQKTVGDYMVNTDENTVWGLEVKTEAENRTGNLFLETWSNRRRWTLGWMFTLQTDILWYYFQDESLLLSMCFPRLKEWAFVRPGRNGLPGRIWDFKCCEQKKRKQMNDSWGRCVPIHILCKEMRVRRYRIAGDLATDETEAPARQRTIFGK